VRNANGVNRTIPIVLILTMAILAGCAHHLAWQRAVDHDDLSAQLDAYFAFLADHDQFAGYALVARNDEIVLAEGYGHEETDQGRSFTADSQFRIASVTKQFTAAAILACQELELLSVDDPVVAYLPHFTGDSAVTIRHLLTHTSGLGPDRALGEAFAYSNEGYRALGSVIEAVSGMPYDAFLQEHVCRPAGLQSTRLWSREGRRPGESSIGAGGLESTAHDLLRWSRYLARSDDDAVISYRALIECTVPALPGVRYGFGIAIRAAEGSSSTSTLYWHAGSAPGTLASLSYLPDVDVTVVILSDSDQIDLFTIESDVYRLVIDAGLTPKP